MTDFSTYEAFRHFADDVKRNRRYFHSSPSRAFLDTLIESAKQRVQVVLEDTAFWRAQVGCLEHPYEQDGVHIVDLPAPYSAERMVPLKDRASEGRANPKGIPYLYGAETRDTAVAETRPWNGAYVSAAIFRTLKELRLVDCASDKPRWTFYLNEPAPELREKAVWDDIDTAFATPIQPSDNTADYAPTQVVAERLRTEGYDGLVFRSSLGESQNIVLFDPTVAQMTHCEVLLIGKHKLSIAPEGGQFSVWNAPGRTGP